jgi:hypothetical protein
MPKCSYHPDIDTEMSCTECGKPICPKEMVSTPVGYKCPDCARPARSQYMYVKPRQLALGSAAGLAAAFVGAFLLANVGFTFFIISIFYGMLVGEAVRRGAGGHRGPIMTGVGIASVVIAGLFTGLGLIGIGMASIGVFSALGWGWGR